MPVGFPEVTPSFLSGQDILYSQFNDVSFYVEDEDQENLYLEVLKFFFPNIKFEKIFPLGGKCFVVKHCAENIGNRNKIYIVDLDFDHLLEQKLDYPNLFYLKKYSIENYFLDQQSIENFIIEQDPKIKRSNIIDHFNVNDFTHECNELLKTLLSCYLIVQKYKLGIRNISTPLSVYFDMSRDPFVAKSEQIQNYIDQVQNKLSEVNSRIKIKSQISRHQSNFSFRKHSGCNIPGKYLLELAKNRIERQFDIAKTNMSSLTFRFAKNCQLEKLNFLKEEIDEFRAN